jgi:Putative zinc-finger
VNIMTDDTHSHSQVWELIPWLVNGSATAAQRRIVEAHVRHCADCRGELDLQQRFRAGMLADAAAAADPQPGLDSLLARIDAEAPGQFPGIAAAPAKSWTPWLAAAIVVQAIGLALLGSALLLRAPVPLAQQPAPTPDYATLSQPAATVETPALRLVAAPDMTLAALRQLLADNDLQVVHSNADGSILGLAPRAAAAPREALTATLARLRASPGVLLAEPVLAPPRTGPAH